MNSESDENRPQTTPEIHPPSISYTLLAVDFSERALTGCTEGAADAGRTELDPAEEARDHDHALEIRVPELFEQPHPRPAHLTVVSGLFYDSTVFVSDPAGPAVVARFVVLLAACSDNLLRLVKGGRGRRQCEKARALLGDGKFGGGGDLWHGMMVPEPRL